MNVTMAGLVGKFSEFEVRALLHCVGLDLLIMLEEMGSVGYDLGREILASRGFYGSN